MKVLERDDMNLYKKTIEQEQENDGDEIVTLPKSFISKVLRLFLKLGVAVTILIFNSAYANDDLQQKMNDPANWASWGGNYQGTRYSKLDQINIENAHQLTPAWTFPTGVKGNYQGGLLVIDDVIYFHTPNTDQLYAVNLSDHTIKWKAEYTFSKKVISQPKGFPDLDEEETDLTNQGVAYAEGKIFWHRLNGELEARDIHTGNVIWSVKNGDLESGIVGGTPPIVVGNKVIVGMAGVQTDLYDYHGSRGYISAYNIDDGTLLWRGYSTGTDKEMLIDPDKTTNWHEGNIQVVGHNENVTSLSTKNRKGSGGAPSGWISYDPKLNLIYYGTASHKQEYSAFFSRGLNVTTHYFMANKTVQYWTSSLWARDATTGKVKWLYQMTPHDQWGYDGTNESILIDQKMNDVLRHTLVHFDKNGFVYVLDRQTGALLKATKFSDIVNWATEINMYSGSPQIEAEQNNVAKIEPSKRGEASYVCPSFYGTKTIQPAAYSPKTNLFYLASTRKCMVIDANRYEDDRVGIYVWRTSHYPHRPDKSYEPGDDAGLLQAWDSTTGKQKWQIIEPYELRTGILATQGDVIFYGTLEGYFKAVNAETGEILYQYKMPMGTVGNISTWSFKGRQYVGVFAGKNRKVDKSMGDFCENSQREGLVRPSEKVIKFYRKIRQQLCLQEQGSVLFSFGLIND